MSTERIPLYGVRMNGRRKKRVLGIRSSDCGGFGAPPHVNEKHREISEQIDRRRVRDGVEHGWIEHDGEKVTDWHVDDDILREGE